MKKDKLSTFLLILILIIGLSLLLYPVISEAWNAKFHSRAIEYYSASVSDMNNSQYDEIWHAARIYNEKLLARENPYTLSAEQKVEYNALLNPANDGSMGYIEIPSINSTLLIYHGTEEAVLQTAIGHLQWTSLPTGGENTHCVFSGHRGLPSAKLFTDLDRLVVGDIFILRIMNEVLTYEVDNISIVEPNEVKELQIENEKDLCTLVTCTPYGINSHRLLVRGHRVESAKEAVIVRITADAIQIEPLLVACIIGIPILMLLFILLFMSDKHSDDRRR